ncbi:AAA family ATPase [Mucilaginibacter sp. Bleaf8]|uniref:P-loop NTPase fold protein n=1 Tax=Mucilaginibacter sp. Bleaf8 TaxID=2834430 RepID=UPI001BCFBFE2|nr:P-loop NTPase fold protein [Mucilaginibacter sp. Bleaf8]MBS7565095.1 AAA family ATPase [Mucilaginibacter sp. Bleaf8]
MENSPWIDNNSIIISFYNHLKNPLNNRILFSAPFGSGKSTFLDEFFNHQSNTFLVLKLNPVNYSVATNEDIFELIKFDIITQILEQWGNELDLRRNDFSALWVIKSFATSKLDYLRIAKAALKAIVPNGENLVDFFETLEATGDDFLKFKKEINDTDASKFKEYLKSFQNNQGSIYERDEFTILINKFVAELKEQHPTKQFVLVVDDLDRLDPEHLFRLFNIFSSHYNNDYSQNKFGLDKVVFVCDINNIHNIFHNRYGQNVEFSGYIDKFYSTEIYHFDNKLFLQNLLYGFVKEKYRGMPRPYHKEYALASRSEFYLAFEFFIVNLIDLGLIKVRSFNHLLFYGLPNYTFTVAERKLHHAGDYEFLVLIYLLKQLFGSLILLESALKVIQERFDHRRTIDYYQSRGQEEFTERYILSISLPFVVEESRISDTRGVTLEQQNFPYESLNGRSLELKYFIDRPKMNSEILKFHFEDAYGGAPPYKKTRVNPFEIFYIGYLRCKRLNYLRESASPFPEEHLIE